MVSRFTAGVAAAAVPGQICAGSQQTDSAAADVSGIRLLHPASCVYCRQSCFIRQTEEDEEDGAAESLNSVWCLGRQDC